MTYQRKPTPMTPESAEAVRTIRASGDFEAAIYAFARAISNLDMIGIHLNRANLPPDTRDLIPAKVEEVLTAFALTKSWLLDIGKAVAKIDEAQKFLKLAMADPEGGSTGAVRDGHDWVKSATAELVTLCRKYAAGVGGDDED